MSLARESQDLTVIIVNYNTSHLLHEAIRSLRDSGASFRLSIAIIDNASRDDSIAVIRRDFSDCDLFANPENVGFGRANNQAINANLGRYVLLLNTDAFVSPDTIGQSIIYMDKHPDCGIMGVKLVGRDGRSQPSARFFPTPWNIFLQRTGLKKIFRSVRLVDDETWDESSARECDWVPGCYLMVRREVIQTVGLFDPRYFMYYEEVDHCFAAKKAGWKVVCNPHTSVVHIGGESAKLAGKVTKSGNQLQALQLESELLYFRKNLGVAYVALDVLLHSVADMVQVIRSLVKTGTHQNPVEHAQHLVTLWYALFKTRFGACPTR